MTAQETKKSLVQSLVLSKLNFNDMVSYPLMMFLQKRMQHVQNAAAGFVLNRFCSEKDEHFKTWLATYTRKHSTEHPRTRTPCSLQQLAGVSDTL